MAILPKDVTFTDCEEGLLRNRKSLVTGGAGFIGSHLVDALISKGEAVTIFDNLSTGSVKNIKTHLDEGSAQLVEADIRNKNEIREALTNVETVFHLAAIASVTYSIQNPTLTNEVNATGTRNLLEASTESGVKRFIYVSTCAAYGEPQYLPIDEDHPINPKSPYAESKVGGEKYCQENRDKYGLKTVTLRLFNVYGLRQSENEYSGVITKFVRNVKEGKPPIICGDGEQTRDFVHVGDVVQALLLSMDTNDGLGQTFNIGTGRSVAIKELCQMLLRKLRADMKPVYDKARPGDIRHSCANITKARAVLGFRPSVSLEKGLEGLTNQRKC